MAFFNNKSHMKKVTSLLSSYPFIQNLNLPPKGVLYEKYLTDTEEEKCIFLSMIVLILTEMNIWVLGIWTIYPAII